MAVSKTAIELLICKIKFLVTCSVRIRLAGVGSKERLRDVAPWVKCPRPAPSTEWQYAHDDAPRAVMHAHRQDFHETFQKVALTDVDHGYITLGIPWQNQQNACPMHKCRFMCAQFNCHFTLSDIQNDPKCCRLQPQNDENNINPHQLSHVLPSVLCAIWKTHAETFDSS